MDRRNGGSRGFPRRVCDVLKRGLQVVGAGAVGAL